MKKSKEIVIVMGALLCVVGIANAAVISELFDAFPGGGTGWSGNWTESGTHTISLSDVSPLKGDGGSYLTYRTAPTAIANANGMGRDFAGSIGSGSYTLTFNVRMDDLGTFYQGNSLTNDRIQLRADTSSGSDDAGANSAWLIMASPNFLAPNKTNWHVYDGSVASSLHGFARANFVNTGIPVAAGRVYTMMVTVYPATRTYDVSIDDGITIGVVKGMEFRSTSTAPADRLVFSNKLRVVPTSGLPDSAPVQMSVDSIHIFASGVHDPQPANNQTQVEVADPVLSWSSVLTYSRDPNNSEVIPDRKSVV